MEANKNSKKIIVLGLILLIVAGLIVISLKGFHVSLMFGKHETIEMKVGKEIHLEEVEKICKEVFQDKEFIVKELEVFGDSFQINVKSMTEDEKKNLVEQVNQKFETQKTVEDLKINTIANKRIRDVVGPYIIPMLIVFGIVMIYALIRFRKIDSLTLVLASIAKIALIEIVLLSVIAIVRIPVDEIVINLWMLVAIAGFVGFLNKAENSLEEASKEE